MPQKLDEIHDSIKRRLSGKINPRTKKPYTESEIWAMAQAQYQEWKKKNKMIEVFTPITKSWTETINKETGEKQRFIEVTVSGLKEDRDGERISQEAILDMINQYKSGKIPLMPNHGQVTPTGERIYRWQDMMGVWVDAKQVGDNLVAVARLNNAHPDADLFWNYIQEGMPIGFSIGAKPIEFIEEEVETIEENTKPEIEKARVTNLEEKRKQLGMSVSEFYAAPRDPPSSSALPIFDEAHVRNAMARFNQTKFRSAEEKAKAKRKIIAAAKKFKINIGAFENA